MCCPSADAEYVSMSNQPYMLRPTFIDLNPDELHYYSHIISLQSRFIAILQYL